MLDRTAIAARWNAQLRDSALPFWLDTVDRSQGGYRLDGRDSRLSLIRSLASRVRRRVPLRLGGRVAPPLEKHLVSQARLLWTFSHAYRLGYGQTCLDAAEHGYRFLVERLLDPAHGGFVWRLDLTGATIDPRKALYGQAFGIYALVEYHRATGGEEPLSLALRTFRLVNDRWREPGGGWREHGESDFGPLVEARGGKPAAPVDRTGLQSANGHLHWMEALSELLEATREAEVRAALVEALQVCCTFFALNPALCTPYREPDGTLIEQGKIGFGHNLEFAWLMVRAQQVLAEPPDWNRFDALVRHALARGFDHQRGGFYERGAGNRPATSQRKVWWVQAEGLAALVTGLKRGPEPELDRALDQLLGWIEARQKGSDGVWIDTLAERGRVLSPVRAGSWKAAYHEVRAETMFIEAYGRSGPERLSQRVTPPD